MEEKKSANSKDTVKIWTGACKILRRVCVLPALWTIILGLPSFVLVAYVLISGQVNTLLAYVSYPLSAYGLIICSTLVYRIVKRTRVGVRENKYWQRYSSDAVLRTKISLDGGVLINIVYIAVKLGYGIYYKSFWFTSVAIYYALLVIIRFYLLHHVRKKAVGAHRTEELKKARICGIQLLLMDLILALMVFFMVYWNRGYEYPGFLIYAMAAYTFYAFTMAIINLVKYRKYGSPVLIAVRTLNLTAALVSILSLETAMLSVFGSGESPAFHGLMIGLTGAGVFVLVFAMALIMIVRTTKILARERAE